ncbi:MAG TPA: PQQ-binding-like beta-propeller repeat protein, partial [Chloroflexota bacterium]|nr:PQQ-binding-like beta-propeller repeat protein [Chloroflexota bacterium]
MKGLRSGPILFGLTLGIVMLCMLLTMVHASSSPADIAPTSGQALTPYADQVTPTQGSVPTSADGNDWPQLGHDAQKSNASPQSVDGPYRFYWRWTDVPFASRVQPVVAGGRLFVGGLNGTFYALDAAYDAEGGAPRVLWQRDLGSPIRSGAAVDGSTVIVGTQHGAIYGLDVSNGQLLWSVSTGGAILAAPLVADTTAYLGSADGSFYALRTSDGSVVWKQSIGAPVLASAALSSDGSRLFFMAENIRVYALSISSGAILWQTSQLSGQSAADRWPVVLGNLVVFRTQPLRVWGELLGDGDAVMDSAGARLSDWGADWARVKPKIIAAIDSDPSRQTLFALDTATGQTKGTAPVLHTFGTEDPASPPAVGNGALYLPYRARHGIQNDSPVAVHVSSKYDADLGRMDPATLDIAGVTASDPFSYQFRLTSDEPGVVSIAGDLLLVDNWERLGGINLSTGRLASLAQVAANSPCWSSLASNDALPPFYEGCPFLGPQVGEGSARSGAVAAAGRIFWHVEASGLAAIGPFDGSSVVQLPAATAEPTQSPLPPASQLPASTLASYVWSEPTLPASVSPDLRLRLESEIAKIVTTGNHLMPFYLQKGNHGIGSYPPDVTNDAKPAQVADSSAFWHDPGELIYSLAITYPYLNPTLQSQLKSYLQSEMNRFPPLSNLPWPTDSWLKQGIARESYQVPMRNSLGTWPPPATPIQTIYALWAYGHYTGDWTYVSSHWSQIQDLFYSKKDQIASYAELSGPIGYARIAKQLGHTAEATTGETMAVSAMQTGYNFQTWLDTANSLYHLTGHYATVEKPGRRAQVFFGLTPEVGRYLHDTNLAAVQQTLNDVVGYPNGSYIWYATRLGTQAERDETSYHTPEIGWSVFMSQAYVNQASQ